MFFFFTIKVLDPNILVYFFINDRISSYFLLIKKKFVFYALRKDIEILIIVNVILSCIKIVY